MVIVYYSHIDKIESTEYSRSFVDPYEARKYYLKLIHIRWYAVGFMTDTDYEYKVMKGYYK